MRTSTEPGPKYSAVNNTDIDVDLQTEQSRGTQRIFLVILFIGSIFAAGFFASHLVDTHCKDVTTRQEWRNLSREERIGYIRAVDCLSKSQSVNYNVTVYEEISWVHRNIGSFSHKAASFLPWHRYFVHIYERTLIDRCGFTGHMPYWDWSLDWQNISNSAIWDPSTGFGGDGDHDGEVVVGVGRCVVDGPFKDLRPLYFGHSFNPHCLSRGFQNNPEPGDRFGSEIRPEAIGNLLSQQTYDGFSGIIETEIHNSLHKLIRGDFASLSATNDPIFFLHHAQIDRLWWQWQERKPGQRHMEYSGIHMNNSTKNATVADILLMAGFADDIPVSEVMNAERGILCYKY